MSFYIDPLVAIEIARHSDDLEISLMRLTSEEDNAYTGLHFNRGERGRHRPLASFSFRPCCMREALVHTREILELMRQAALTTLPHCEMVGRLLGSNRDPFVERERILPPMIVDRIVGVLCVNHAFFSCDYEAVVPACEPDGQLAATT